MSLFDPNKRGAYPVVRSQWPGMSPLTRQERRETVWAVICVSCILLASVVFLWLAYIAD